MSNDPNPEQDDWLLRYRRQEEQRQRHAEEMARYLSGALRFLGVSRVETTFDGYGDDGEMGDIKYIPAPLTTLPLGVDSSMGLIFDSMLPGGWEINAGSFGSISLDVASAKVSVDMEWREDDEDPEWDEEEME